MNFDQRYSEVMNKVLFERQGSIILYPGGFKPPHKGHFEALKYMIHKYDGQMAIVFIGNKERDGITPEQSQKIWEVYGKYIGVPLEVHASPVSPVKSVYDYTDAHKNEFIVVGAGEDDLARYNYFKKNKETYPNVVVCPIPPQFGRISGTDTREKLAAKAEDAYSFIPNEAECDVDVIKAILS